MRVKLDENVTHAAVGVFTARGHDVHTIPDEGLVGHADESVWAACVAEHRILVTFDLGFGDLRAYPPSHPGVVVLRLPDQRPAVVTDVLGRFLADHDLDALAGHLVVVTDSVVRWRRD